MGNLARDPEIRVTPTKQTVARLTVAVGRQWKAKTGELQSQTDFIPVIVWGPQAENCERYLRKGRPVLIEGRLQVRDFEDKNGQRRWVTEVVSQSVFFLGSAKQEEGAGTPSGFEFDQGKRDSFGSGFTPGNGGSLREEEDFPDSEFTLDISRIKEDEGEADIPF